MKDAKGHGSDAHGGGPNSPDVKANIQKAARLAKTLGPDHPSVGAALHDAVMAARPAGGFYKIPANGGQPVASNAHAAATLASGSKSAPVDTHPAQSAPRGNNSLDVYGDAGRKAAIARRQGDEAAARSHSDWANRAIGFEKGGYAKAARQRFNDEYHVAAARQFAPFK